MSVTGINHSPGTNVYISYIFIAVIEIMTKAGWRGKSLLQFTL